MGYSPYLNLGNKKKRIQSYGGGEAYIGGNLNLLSYYELLGVNMLASVLLDLNSIVPMDLYSPPAGKVVIPTMFILRDIDVNLTFYSGNLTLSEVNGLSTLGIQPLSNIFTTSATVIIFYLGELAGLGPAKKISFGNKLQINLDVAFESSAFGRIDLFGYLIDI